MGLSGGTGQNYVVGVFIYASPRMHFVESCMQRPGNIKMPAATHRPWLSSSGANKSQRIYTLWLFASFVCTRQSTFCCSDGIKTSCRCLNYFLARRWILLCGSRQRNIKLKLVGGNIFAPRCWDESEEMHLCSSSWLNLLRCKSPRRERVCCLTYCVHVQYSLEERGGGGAIRSLASWAFLAYITRQLLAHSTANIYSSSATSACGALKLVWVWLKRDATNSIKLPSICTFATWCKLKLCLMTQSELGN